MNLNSVSEFFTGLGGIFLSEFEPAKTVNNGD